MSTTPLLFQNEDLKLGNDKKPICPLCDSEAALGKQRFCSGCGFRMWPVPCVRQYGKSGAPPPLPSTPPPGLSRMTKTPVAASSSAPATLNSFAGVETDAYFAEVSLLCITINAVAEQKSKKLYFTPYTLVSEALEQISSIFWAPASATPEQMRYALFWPSGKRFLATNRTLLTYHLPSQCELELKQKQQKVKYARIEVLQFSVSTFLVDEDSTGYDLVLKLLRKHNNISLSDEKRPPELRTKPHMLKLYLSGNTTNLQIMEEKTVFKQVPEMLDVQPMKFCLPGTLPSKVSKNRKISSVSKQSHFRKSSSVSSLSSSDGFGAWFGKKKRKGTKSKKSPSNIKSTDDASTSDNATSGALVSHASSTSNLLSSSSSGSNSGASSLDTGIQDGLDPSETLSLRLYSADGFFHQNNDKGSTKIHMFKPTAPVRQCIKKILKIYPVSDDVNQYGLYSPDKNISSNCWFESTVPISSFKIPTSAVIEFKKRYVTYRITLPKNRQVYYQFDQRAEVRACFTVLYHNFSYLIDGPPSDYGLFIPGDVEGELELDRTLWSYTSEPSQTIEFRKRLQPLTIFERGREQIFQVDYLKPFSQFIGMISTTFGHDELTESTCSLQQLGLIGMPVSFDKPLLAQGIRFPATLILKVYQSVGASSSTDTTNKYDTVNIWDEPSDETTVKYEKVSDDHGRPVIMASTLNKLVEQLTATNVGPFSKAFLLTYQSFTTPTMLLQKLIERYRVPPSQAKLSQVVKLRVMNTLRLWLESFIDDFDAQTLKDLRDFIRFEVDAGSSESGSSTSGSVARQYCQKIMKLTEPRSKQPPTPRIRTSVCNDSFKPTQSIFDFPEEAIAAQLTRIDFEIYASIKPKEFLNQCWSKEETQSKCPNVMEMINRFNAFSMWVAFLIVEPARVRQRAKRFEKLIAIAEHLLKANNFQTLMAFLGGMNNSSISRLKFTASAMSKRALQKLQDIEKLMNMESSYAKYREALHAADPPIIPYLGVYLADLTFIEDGNPDTIDGLIHFSKRQLLYKVVSEIQQYQNKRPSVPEDQTICQLFTELPLYTEKELYSMSLDREPRGSSRKDIK